MSCSIGGGLLDAYEQGYWELPTNSAGLRNPGEFVKLKDWVWSPGLLLCRATRSGHAHRAGALQGRPQGTLEKTPPPDTARGRPCVVTAY